jgi:hypothetical protein
MGFDSRDAHVAAPPSAVEFQLFRSPAVTRDLGDPPAVHPSSSQFGVGLIPGLSGQQLEASRQQLSCQRPSRYRFSSLEGNMPLYHLFAFKSSKTIVLGPK